jgi:predicted dehydrogenase
MVDRLRVGLVGPSWFAETVHLSGLDSHPRAQFTAVCGRSRENAEAVAARHGNPAVFTDYRSMLSSGLLDAVVVAVPDHLHLDVTLAAVESGLHVLCEKPLAHAPPTMLGGCSTRQLLPASST